MKMLSLSFLILSSLFLLGQELPPIKKFSAEEYGGDNQNWMISQSEAKCIYVANNRGLLEYNGSTWSTYPSPNNTIIRAVNVIGDKIYTGCYAEFGYWEKNDFGKLIYTSLIGKLGEEHAMDEQIWNIIDYNDWIIFQSNSAIYFYNSETEAFKVVKADNLIYKIFRIDDKILYHVANEGIYCIENGAPKLLLDSPIINKDRVINVFKKEEGYLILTRKSGFYRLEETTLTPWRIQVDKQLKRTSVFSSIELEDGSFVIGTISDGLIHIDPKGNFKYQITQKTGLGNNTVLTIFEDDAHNVWVGLDNGINCININTAVKTFFDFEGVLGTVYTTQVFKGYLYIGSNQGLFYRKLDDPSSQFTFIEQTAGQVWSLYNHNNQYLFCGHHLGTFLIDQTKATKISDELGAWNFKRIPGEENLLLQGNYKGLFVLENIDGMWKTRNSISGFQQSSRYFEINAAKQAWVSHEYKGIFKLTLNDTYTKVLKKEKEGALPLGKNSSLIKHKGTILYASQAGIYVYNSSAKAFERDSLLSKSYNASEYISGKMVVDKVGRLWTFSKEKISFVETDNVTNKPFIQEVPISSTLRKGVLGYENISLIDDDKYVLGTANGYITLDLKEVHNKMDYALQLKAVSLYSKVDTVQKLKIEGNTSIKHKAGILMFEYAVPEYDNYLDVQYQHKLEGDVDKWSKWQAQAQTSFENLSFGSYTFKVRAKVGNTPSNNLISYDFEVKRPWYISNLALIVYFLLFTLIGFITHKAYKRYYLKKFARKQMLNEQTIMQMKNEKLNQDIENKNRELAISTMSIIKKNRVLNKIKKELKKKPNADNKIAIQLIDGNLNDADDWSFFEQAFNNADKDFMDKIKKAHPNLTPNDLRFCAYLRLNLSSKEMAPLLNISLKSVETKRYRLRKKLGLEHDSGLVEYILKF